MKLNKSPAMLMLVGGGFLMFIDTLVAWQSINSDGLTYTRSAWADFNFWGLILGLMSIAFFANALVQSGIVESKFQLPNRLISVILAPAILVFAVIKNIDDEKSAWGSYLGIVLAALITVGAWLAWKEQPAADAPVGELPPATTSAPPSKAPPESPASPPANTG